MIVDVVNALFGLINFISTWRFSLVASIGAVCALFVFFRLHNPVQGLVMAIALFGISSWIGYRWQNTFEIRRRQPSNNRWRGP
jgi:hypothetical protein